LDAAPWTNQKIVRRIAKQVVFIGVSAVIAHMFLAYFVSIPELWSMMRSAPGEHWTSFVFVFAATAALYFNFSWFREQLCIVICPYGRMQSALMDDHTMIIGYDVTRGEPRGRLGTVNAGACVDCNRCVQVCPTGIDIRQGVQVECIGCAACIDACDQVMTKIKRPTGLIRYDSAQGFAGRKTRWARPRTYLYGVLLAIGATVALSAISGVRPGAMSFTRMRGAPYFVDDLTVRNQYLVRLVNKRSEPVKFVLKPQVLPAGATTVGFETAIELPALGEEVRPLVVSVPRDKYAGNSQLKFELSDEAGSFTVQRTAEFVGPDPELLREDSQKR
jgi:cytochrome c oxidase accessory protein FixG